MAGLPWKILFHLRALPAGESERGANRRLELDNEKRHVCVGHEIPS